MPTFTCDAIATVSTVCTVEAASEAEALAKFRAGEWDRHDSLDDGVVYEVKCVMASVKADE